MNKIKYNKPASYIQPEYDNTIKDGKMPINNSQHLAKDMNTTPKFSQTVPKKTIEMRIDFGDVSVLN